MVFENPIEVLYDYTVQQTLRFNICSTENEKISLNNKQSFLM